MPARLIDELFVAFGFRADTSGLDRVIRKTRDFDREIRRIGRGIDIALGAALGIGSAAFFTGSKAERELIKLRTQLGDTADQVEAVRPRLRALSSETGQPYERLAAAFFNLKSSVQGISDENALEVVTASAKGATIELGEVGDLALLAGLGIRTFGEDVMSGQKALDILHSTIKSGTIPDTRALASSFGRLLTPGKELNITFEELGAVVAGYSPTGPISETINAVRATLIQLLAPSTEAVPILQDVFGGAEDAVELLHKRIGKEGLLKTLKFLRTELGDDTVAFRKFLGSQEAVNFVLDATGDNFEVYANALEANRNAIGSVNKGLEIFRTTGAFPAQLATNELRLALLNFYNIALVPLLRLFGKLPTSIQTVVAGMATLSVASSLLGGPSLGRLIASVIFADKSLALLRVQVWLLDVQARLTAIATGIWRNALLATRIQMALHTIQTWAATLAHSTLVVSLKAAARSTWGFIASLSAARIAQLASVVATGAATAATWAFNAALLANPITWIVLAIAGLIAGLVLLVKNWDAVRDAIGRAWERVRSFFSGLPGWVTVALAVIAPFIGIPILIIKHWDTLKTFFANLWDWIVDKVMWAWNQVSGIFDAIGGFFGFGGGEIEVRTSTRANPAPPAVPTLDEGGIVRRPTLAMLAINRQPEAVVPLSLLNQLTDKLKAMLNSLDRFIADFRATQAGKNFVANLPVLMDPSKPLFPTVPPRAFAGAGAGPTYIDNRTVNVSEGAVVVNAAPGQDPVEIAQVVTQRLRDQIQAIPPAFDSGIKR